MLIYNLKPISDNFAGVLCLECGTLLVSWETWDNKTCGCENSTMVDGGRSFLRYGGKDMTKVQIVGVSPMKSTTTPPVES